MSSRVIHGYQPTSIICPYCGDRYGMREVDDDGRIVYRCWCGATARLDEEAQ